MIAQDRLLRAGFALSLLATAGALAGCVGDPPVSTTTERTTTTTVAPPTPDMPPPVQSTTTTTTHTQTPGN